MHTHFHTHTTIHPHSSLPHSHSLPSTGWSSVLGYTLFCDAPRFSRYSPSPPVQHTRRKKYQSPCHKEQLHHFSKLTSSSVSLVRVLWSMWMTLRASPFASCNALSFWDFDDRMIPFTTRTIRHNRRRMTNWAISSKPSSSALEHKNTEQINYHIVWLNRYNVHICTIQVTKFHIHVLCHVCTVSNA